MQATARGVRGAALFLLALAALPSCQGQAGDICDWSRPGPYGLEAASVSGVTRGTAVDLTLLETTNPAFAPTSKSQRGDYFFAAPIATSVVMATPSQNTPPLTVTSFSRVASGTDPEGYFVGLFVARQTGETDGNVAVARFDLTAGYVGGRWEGNALGAMSPGLTASALQDKSDGTYSLRLPGIRSDANKGLLLCTAGSNSNRVCRTEPVFDGSFKLTLRAPSPSNQLVDDDLSFVYVNNTDPNTISGRIWGDGRVDVSNGDFVVVPSAVGQYRLSITCETPASGILILSAEGGGASNTDKIFSYEADADGSSWIIYSRSVTTGALETVLPSDRAFSFVFVKFSDEDTCVVSNSCQNGATCVDGFRTSTCICPLNAGGDRCEVPCPGTRVVPDGVRFGDIDITQTGTGANDVSARFVRISRGGLQITAENFGDFPVNFGFSSSYDAGVALASVRQNGVDHGSGFEIGTVRTEQALPFSKPTDYNFEIFRAGVTSATQEMNINLAVAHFAFSDFYTGITTVDSSNAVKSLHASPSLRLGVEFIDNRNGTYGVELPSPTTNNFQTGVLLVNAGSNTDGSWALSAPNPATNGFTIFNRANNHKNQVNYVPDPVAFAFIPNGLSGVISGRVRGNGVPEVKSGIFTVTNIGTGQYRLEVPCYDPVSAMLMVSPEGGQTVNNDNIWTYEAQADGTWLLESRDITTLELETVPANERAFSFAVFTYADGDSCANPDLCFHGGTCTDGYRAFRCECLPNFIGTRCEHVDNTHTAATTMHSCAELQAAGQTRSGTYWMNPSGTQATTVYCDMDSDGGGWTLLVTSTLPNSRQAWTTETVLNYNGPSLAYAHSRLQFADAMKTNGYNTSSRMLYRIEAANRGEWGGIFEVPSSYSFVSTSNTQTDVTVLKRFGDWAFGDASIERRMPYLGVTGCSGLLTTSNLCGSTWWGTLVSSSADYDPAPWISGLQPNPKIIWYWMKESVVLPQGEGTAKSCMDLYARGTRASGVYTINPSGLNAFPVYCDMERDGGGWTLLVTSTTPDWTPASILTRNTGTPSLEAPYSILEYGDTIRRFGYQPGDTFQYRLEASERGRFGGVFEVPSTYSFTTTTNTQTDVTLLKRFDNWMFDDNGIEQRMPYVGEGACYGVLTTSAACSGSWWGTVASSRAGYNAGPWIYCTDIGCGRVPAAERPQVVWYWMRESYTPPANRTRSCLDLQNTGAAGASGIYSINPTGFDEFPVYCDFDFNGGGWTLLTTAASTAWSYWQVEQRNLATPDLNSDYSMLGRSTALLYMTLGRGGQMEAAARGGAAAVAAIPTTFDYRLEGWRRQRFGGIFTAPASASLLSRAVTTAAVTLKQAFDVWQTYSQGIGMRVPWISRSCNLILTTAPRCVDNAFGSIISTSANYTPAPWVDACDGCVSVRSSPGRIWYWIREGTPSCDFATQYRDSSLGGCRPLTVCNATTQYEAQAPTSNADRVCALLTECAPGSTEDSPPTPTTDRTCAPCVSGTFKATAGQAPCQPYSDCPAETVEVLAPSRFHDRACGHCPPNQHKSGSGNMAACVPHTNCALGHIVAAAPTATSDRICAPCPSGQWQTLTNVDVCMPWSPPCPAGSVQTQAPTASSDRVCTACDGTSGYQDVAGSTAPCKPVSACRANQFESMAPTSTSDRQCTNCTVCGGADQYLAIPCGVASDAICGLCDRSCPAGQEQTGTCGMGSSALRCVDCPAGLYKTTNDDARCRNCPGTLVCPQGLEQRGTCGGAINTVNCSACEDGQYKSGISGNCVPCPADPVCSANQVLVGACGGDTDTRVCQSCPSTPSVTYLDPDTKECNECSTAPSSTCGKGTGRQGLCSPSDGLTYSCAPCSSGQFQPSDVGIDCQPWTACPLASGQYVAVAGTSTSDAVCGTVRECVAGFEFQVSPPTQTSNRVCQAIKVCDASAGQVVTVAATATSDRMCGQCLAGQYPTASGCRPCPTGTWSAAGATACSDYTTCLPGTGMTVAPSPTNDRVCAPCVAGVTYSQGGLCVGVDSCPPGSIVVRGATLFAPPVCQACVDGYYADGDTCLPLTTCTPGSQFLSSPGSTQTNAVCLPCSECPSSAYISGGCDGGAQDTVCSPCLTAANCTAGTYLEGDCGGADGTEAPTCMACDPSCATCAGPTSLDCTSCGVSEYLLAGPGSSPGLGMPGAPVGQCRLKEPCTAPGTYEVQAATPTSDHVCGFCAAGTQPNAAKTGCVPCADNEVSINGTRCQACYDGSTPLLDSPTGGCVPCPVGQFGTGGRCAPCSAGTFADSILSTSCRPFSTCTTHEYQTVAPTPTNDRQCRSITFCVLGQEYEVQAPTATSDRMCSTCTPCTRLLEYASQACGGTQNRVCTATTACSSSEFEAQAPTLTSDRVCLPRLQLSTVDLLFALPMRNIVDQDYFIGNLTQAVRQAGVTGYVEVRLSAASASTTRAIVSVAYEAAKNLVEDKAKRGEIVVSVQETTGSSGSGSVQTEPVKATLAPSGSSASSSSSSNNSGRNGLVVVVVLLIIVIVVLAIFVHKYRKKANGADLPTPSFRYSTSEHSLSTDATKGAGAGGGNLAFHNPTYAITDTNMRVNPIHSLHSDEADDLYAEPPQMSPFAVDEAGGDESGYMEVKSGPGFAGYGDGSDNGYITVDASKGSAEA